MAAALTLRGITKSFGPVKVVDDLSLEVEEGQLFTFLGPSGCGKTTTLRMIAGLERPDRGEILLKGRTIASHSKRIHLNPEKRNMGMVFQSYAIWPTMTVFQNVAYPLELRKMSRAVIKEKVRRVLSLVGLEELENRPAPRLSGGQQQRVALARALVYEPEVLLLDEPLSNLDAQLREQMRVELKLLQRRLGITLVYVTHDQLEALSLSDQVVVLSQGRIEQQGTPRHLYEQPQSAFVRDFLGKTIVLEGRVQAIEVRTIQVALTRAPGTPIDCPNHGSLAVRQDIYLSVRPEDIVIAEQDCEKGGNNLKGTIETMLFVGDRSECQVKVGGEKILVYVPRKKLFEAGQAISLHIPRDAVSLWPA
ncbi:MAG: ABC transporter ATP-binding protein [Deltaproteobacteria bacterium]|nr:ABC transporter ATP-binding protein [Deltaproteobacteria bacterium]